MAKQTKKYRKLSNRNRRNNHSLKARCASKKVNIKTTKTDGDLHYCNKGYGSCRKIKGRYNSSYVSCKPKKRTLKTLGKKKCKKGYTDCKHYGVGPIPRNRLLPKSSIFNINLRPEPDKRMNEYFN